MSTQRPRKMHKRWALACIFVLFVGGCFPPSQVDRDNRKLVDAVLTAITMKNANWLEDDAALAETRHESGEFADDDYEALLSIIETARSGEWKAAEKEAYEFRKRRPFLRDGE